MEPDKLSRLWLTLSLRLTVFPATEWAAPSDLWERVVGLPPENVQSQPRQRLQVQGGPWEGGALQVNVAPTAVIWIAQPPATEEGLPAAKNWPVREVLPKFVALTRAWLASVDVGVNRIGFGLHTVLPAPDKSAAYGMLDELIQSVEIDPELTSDFQYQINRPIQSKVLGNDVRLNRFMKWSAPIFRVGSMQVTPTGLVQIGPPIGDTYAGLENDVNTPAERTEPLPRNRLGAIYDELVELALQNLERGEKA